MNNSITQKRLKELLHYDPDTGIFTWIVKRGSFVNAGDVADHKSIDGYIRIGVEGVYYPGHRLAWLYMTGEWPKNLVDHTNNIKDDNRWSNLRDATSRQNNWNKKVQRRNKAGIKGVSEYKGKFRVYLCLGSYNTKEEAAKVYNEAASKLQGEFTHKSVKLNARVAELVDASDLKSVAG